MKRCFSITAALIGALWVTGCQSSHDSHHHSAAKAYTSNKCLVSGEPLGDHPISKVVDGQEIKFCCKDCVKEFEKDPAKFLSKVK